MSTVNRTLLRLVVFLFAVLYLAFPYGVAYAVVWMYRGPVWAVFAFGVVLQYIVIAREPSILMNLALSLWLEAIAAPMGRFFAKASFSPSGRLAAAATAANLYRQRGELDIAGELADRGRVDWEKVKHRRSSTQYFAACSNVKGDVFLQRGMFQEALNSYYEPLALHAASGAVKTTAYLNCAAAMNALGLFREALEYLDYVRSLNPNPLMTTVMHCHAAMALVEMGSLAQARHAADQALSTANGPMSTAQATVISGWVWVSMGDFDKAKEALALSKQLVENKQVPGTMRPALRMRMGVIEARILEGDGQVEKAIAVLSQTATDGPRAVSALNALAEMYERHGRIHEARTCRDRLVREVPQSAFAKRILAGTTPLV